MTSETPARPGDESPVTDLETALGNAERFLAKSCEGVYPNLSPRTLMRYLDQYRTHLCAVVASTRRAQGLTIGHSMRQSQGR